MSALRSVLESGMMADIYTCSVCGMKISLNMLTEHVLLHDQYSAFSYNETTKIIEPLDEVQEQILQERHTSSHLSPKSAHAYQPAPSTHAYQPAPSTHAYQPAPSTHAYQPAPSTHAYHPAPSTYLPAGASEPIENPAVESMTYSNGVPAPYENNYPYNVNSMSPGQNKDTKSYHIVSQLQKRLSTTPLDNLTGIQMIASVAESLGRNVQPETDGVWTDEFGRLNVDTPLNSGDVIGTLKLPYIENGVGTDTGVLCECSIVFNRFVSIADCKEYYVDIKKEPEYSEVSLQDIIDGEIEDEDFGEDCISHNSEFLKQKKFELHQSVPRGGKTGRKMEVYKYKEPEVANEIQNELQKTIVAVPELLKDPAVVKYLETMTGKAIEPVKDETETHNTETDPVVETDEKNHARNGTMNEDKKLEIDIETQGDSSVVEQPNRSIEPNESVETNAKDKKRELDQKEFKKNKIMVKWDQNTACDEKTENGNDKQQCMDISLSDKMEEKGPRETYMNCDEEAGSENDDAEQEMMDIESDIEETSNCNETMDTVGEKHVSVLSYKVEKFGKDITDNVNEKFSDELNVENEKGANEASSKEEPGYNTNSTSNEKLPRYPEYDSEGKEVDVFEDDASAVKTNCENKLSCKNLKFSCSVCEKTVDSIKNLRKHFLTHETHSKEPRKSLRVINKRINILSKKVVESLNKPSEQSSDYLLFYCMVCDEMFPTQQELHEHCKAHKKDDVYSDGNFKLDGTSASEDTLTADSDIEQDIRNEKKLESYIVHKSKSQKRRSDRTLAAKFKQKDKESGLEAENEVKQRTKEKVNEMSRKKTISKDYICENCGEGFLKIQECIAHSEQCMETGKLKCFQGCGYNFKTRSELDVHKRFCSRRVAYLERINKEFVKKELLDQTEGDTFEIDDADEDAVVVCPFCNQNYQTEQKMMNHKLVCPARPKQKCDHCDFECKGDKAMGKHLVEKHNLKPFRCEQCPRSFRLKGSLRDHVRYAHTRETFTCEYCGKSFIKQSIYRSHVSIQHEGFRLVCSYCGKKFKDKRTWLIHEKSHKGAYDYACTMCKKTFNRSEQYRSHMQEMHSIEGKAALSLNSAAKELRDKLCSNICSICKETFPLETAYTIHMMKVHGQV